MSNRFENLNDTELFILINVVHSIIPSDVDHMANQMFEGLGRGKADMKSIMKEMINAIEDDEMRKTIKRKVAQVNRG